MKRLVRIGSDNEWVREFHSCGRTMVFTMNIAEAEVFDWNYTPCRERAMEIIRVANGLYRRSFWGQEIKEN